MQIDKSWISEQASPCAPAILSMCLIGRTNLRLQIASQEMYMGTPVDNVNKTTDDMGLEFLSLPPPQRVSYVKEI